MVFGQVKVVCGGTSWQLMKRRQCRDGFFLIMMVVDEERDNGEYIGLFVVKRRGETS